MRDEEGKIGYQKFNVNDKEFVMICAVSNLMLASILHTTAHIFDVVSGQQSRELGKKFNPVTHMCCLTTISYCVCVCGYGKSDF